MAQTEERTVSLQALQSKALTWFRYDVHEQRASLELMSFAARAIDHELMRDAWVARGGACTVTVARLHARCNREQLDAGAIQDELLQSGRWVLNDDAKSMTCTWLRESRVIGAEAIEQRISAGQQSAIARQKKAEEKRRRREAYLAQKAAKDATERPLNGRSRGAKGANHTPANSETETSDNPLPDVQLERVSTAVEHKMLVRSSSLPSVENELLRTANADSAFEATAPSASHAGGAAVAVAVVESPGPRRPGDPGFLLQLQALTRLEGVQLAPGFVVGDVATLVAKLRLAAPYVDVERALYRLCAAWQRTHGAEAHQPLLDEIHALLVGADCRDGYLAADQAPRAIALALHGTLIMPDRVTPLVVRAVATDIALEIPADDPMALGRAVTIAGEYARGTRKASARELAGDLVAAPTLSRLNGYRTRAEVVA
ncbi:MAG TPA: hypothetical protein VE861_15075 [Gemmatimonadaceae bacterium]|nr:hypothetical protein [Gemmatimonadaceae bacterium]